MAIVNEAKRSVPPFPDPRDTDQGRINRQIIDLMRYLNSRIDTVSSEERLSKIESVLKEHEDIING
jgi:hypothetical protein